MNEEKKKTEYPIKTFRMSEEVYLSLKEERFSHESWNQLFIRLLNKKNEKENKIWSFSKRTEGTLRRFLKESSKEEIKEAMCFAVNRVNDPEGAYRYFCGIMWNKIKKRRIELLWQNQWQTK